MTIGHLGDLYRRLDSRASRPPIPAIKKLMRLTLVNIVPKIKERPFDRTSLRHFDLCSGTARLRAYQL